MSRLDGLPLEECLKKSTAFWRRLSHVAFWVERGAPNPNPPAPDEDDDEQDEPLPLPAAQDVR